MNVQWVSLIVVLTIQLLSILTLVLLLYAKKGNQTASYFLAAYIGVTVLYLSLGALSFTGLILKVPFLFRLDSPLHYIAGPLIYLYVKSSIYRNYRVSKWEWLLFLPAALHILELMPVYFMPLEQKVAHIKYLLYVKKNTSQPYHSMIKYCYGVSIVIASTVVFVKYRWYARKHHLPQNKPYNRWITVFLLSFVWYYSTKWWVPLIPELFQLNKLAYISFFISLLHLILGVSLILSPQILYGALFDGTESKTGTVRNGEVTSEEANEEKPGPAESQTEIPSPIKYKNSPLTTEQKEMYFGQLQAHMEKEKPFLDNTISLQELAYTLNIPVPYLSQVINELGKCHFFDYINAYRVDYVKKQLTQERLAKITIAGLGNEAGFKSKTTFYSAFKKVTGMTPTEYINQKEVASEAS